jgi:hypothetical protein
LRLEKIGDNMQAVLENCMKLHSLFKPPTPAQREHWQQVKARGKKKYILSFGILRYGGTMFVVMTALELIRRTPPPRAPVDYAFVIALNLVVWPLAGYVCGLLTWRVYEKKFSEGDDQPTNQR